MSPDRHGFLDLLDFLQQAHESAAWKYQTDINYDPNDQIDSQVGLVYDWSVGVMSGVYDVTDVRYYVEDKSTPDRL